MLVVSSKMGTYIFVATIIYVAFLTVKSQEYDFDEQYFGVPFKINPANGESVYGDTRITDADDDRIPVTLSKMFPFESQSFNKFYIDPNGVIKALNKEYLAAGNEWYDFDKYSIQIFQQDVDLSNRGCDGENEGCGIYWRKGDSRTTAAIKKLVKDADMKRWSHGEAIEEFNPDPELTLVVTWYRVMQYTNPKSPTPKRNTFQGVITSDGTKSYAIYSYQNLTYPAPPPPGSSQPVNYKAGVVFNADDANNDVKWCQLPVDLLRTRTVEYKENLLCQTNAYKKGVFVVGLTKKSFPTCENLKTDNVKRSAAHHYVDATCAHCQDTAVNTRANEGSCSSQKNKQVCGSDDTTYDSICELRQQACRVFNGTLNLFEGKKCYRSPCLTNNGGCEETCNVDPKNKEMAKCSCSDGKQLKKDGKSCSYSNFYYTASENKIILRYGQKRMSIPAQGGNGNVKAVTHDYDNNTIFYTRRADDNKNSTLWSFKPPQHYREIAQLPGNTTSLTFDPESNTIYASNEQGAVSQVVDIYQTPSVAAYSQFESVSDMKFESCQRKLFVADQKAGKIYLFKKSTRNDEDAVIVKGLRGLTSLALDQENHKLFWYSDGNGFESSNYDGSCKSNFLPDTGLHAHRRNSRPIGMAYDRNSEGLVWIDENRHNGEYQIVQSMSTNSQNFSMLEKRESFNNTLNGFGIFYPYVSEKANCQHKLVCNDPCGMDKGGCEVSCSSDYNEKRQKYAQCGCERGQQLKRDGKTCDFSGSFFVGGHNEISIGRFQNKNDRPLKVSVSGTVTSVVFDQTSNTFIFATKTKKKDGNMRFDISRTTLRSKKPTLLVGNMDSEVVGFVLDSKDSSVMYALKNGTMRNIVGIYSKNVRIEDVKQYQGILAIEEEPCNGEVFVLERKHDGSGRIVVHGNNPRVLIDDLHHPKTMTMDRRNHNLFYASSRGIEESKYDGSCRSMVRAREAGDFNMVFANGRLYLNGDGSMRYVNFKNGSITEQLRQKDMFTIGVVKASDDWKQARELIGKQVMLKRVQKFNIAKLMAADKKNKKFQREFRISFKFQATTSQHATRSIIQFGYDGEKKSDQNQSPGFYHHQGGLLVVFGNGRNFTVDGITTQTWYTVRLSQERDGNSFRTFLHVNNKLEHQFTVEKDDLPAMKNFYIQRSRNERDVQDGFIKNLEFQRKVTAAVCPISKKCSVHCTADNARGVCEESCVRGGKDTSDRCQCADGKSLKPDQVSCDWSHYGYFGFNNFVYMYNTPANVNMSFMATGEVKGITHDYQNNYIIYSNSRQMKDGSMEHSIHLFHPKKSEQHYQSNRTAIRNLTGQAEFLNYHPMTQGLSFAIGQGIYMIDNVHAPHPKVRQVWQEEGDITGLVVKPCTKKNETEWFYAVNGSIYRNTDGQDRSARTEVDTYGKDAFRLTLDTWHHKIIWSAGNDDNHTLEESSYNGTCHRTITKIQGKPYSMELIWGNYLVWSNMIPIRMNNMRHATFTTASTDINTGITTYHPTQVQAFGTGMIYDRKQQNSLYCPVQSQCVGTCQDNNGGCQDKCTMLAGRASCSCVRGQLRADRKTCDFTDYVIYSSGSMIHGLHKASKGSFMVETNNTVNALEYDYKKSVIFYSTFDSNNNHAQIRMFNMAGKGEHTTLVANNTGGKVNHLSYCGGSENLYYADSESFYVRKMVYDANSQWQMLGNVTWMNATIDGFAYESCKKDLFIMSSSMGRICAWNNETGFRDVVTGLKRPSSLTLDRSVKRLYYFDSNKYYSDVTEGDYKIMEVSYDGKCKRQVSYSAERGGVNWWMESGLKPDSLAVANSKNNMVWTDKQKNKAIRMTYDNYQAYKNGSYGNSTFKDGYAVMTTSMDMGKSSVYHYSDNRIGDVQMIHDRNKDAECEHMDAVCSHCTYENGECEDRCIPQHGSFKSTCACTHGKVGKDGLRCDFNGYEIYASVDFVHMQDSSKKDEFTHLFEGEALGVEYDYDKNIVFYSVEKTDQQTGMKSYEINGFDAKGERYNYYKGDKAVERLAFDQSRGDMYFTTPNYLHVLRDIYFSNRTSTNLTRFMDTNGLAFEPCKRMVYVLCSGSLGLYGWDIEEGKLKHILKDLKAPKALAIDIGHHKLYFFEEHRITQSSYDGKCVNTIATLDKNNDIQPYEIAVGTTRLWVHDTKLRSDGYRMYSIDIKNGSMAVAHTGHYKFNSLKFIWDRKSVNTPDVCKWIGKDCIAGGCRNKNGGCEDKCIAEDNFEKVRCECTNGILRPDGKGCDWANYFVMGGNHSVYMFGRTFVHVKVEGRDYGQVLAVDYDQRKNHIFYSVKTESGGSEVRMYNAKGEHTTFFKHPTEDIEHISYAFGERLFYAWEQGVGVYDINKKTYRVLNGIQKGALDEIKQIIYEPCEHRLFISTRNKHIRRNGNNQWRNSKIWVWKETGRFWRLEKSIDVAQHSGLTIDVTESKLYFFEEETEDQWRLQEMNYDGSCKRRISDRNHNGLEESTEAVYVSHQESVYWGSVKNDKQTRVLLKMNVRNGEVTEARQSQEHINGVVSYLQNRALLANCPARNRVNKECKQFNDCNKLDCSEYCYRENGKARCACRYGATLKSDGKSCDYSNVFYAAAGRYVTVFNARNSTKQELFAVGENHITAVTHCPKCEFVFYVWQEGKSAILMRRTMTGKRETVRIAQGPYGHVTSMAYDYVKHELYFASKNGGIYKMPMNKGNMVGVHNLGLAAHAQEMVLSYCSNDLLWLDYSNNFGKVMRIRDEAEASSKLINYAYSSMTGLTMDRQHNTLYWYDAHSKTIQESRADFTCQRTVGKITGRHIKSMVYMDGMLYYVKEVDVYTQREHMYMMDVNSGVQQMSGMSAGMYDMGIYRMKEFFSAEESGMATPEPKKMAYREIYDGKSKWYRFHNDKQNFNDAVETCKKEGGRLAYIDDKHTYDFVGEEFRKTKPDPSEGGLTMMWLGGRDQKSNGDFKWLNDKHVNIEYWQVGEPNNNKGVQEDCLGTVVAFPLKLYDAPCNTQANFLCQFDSSPTPRPRTQPSMPRTTPAPSSPPTASPVSGNATEIKPAPTVDKTDYNQCMDSPYAQGNCATWKSYGTCENKDHRENMKQVCKKTCGFCDECSDNPMALGKCAEWKASNQCTQQPTNMKYMCEKTCGFCTGKNPTPSSSSDYRKGPDGDDYKFVQEMKTWQEAALHCHNEGAKLVTVDSKIQKDWLVRTFDSDFWTGLNDKEHDGKWMWEDEREVGGQKFWAANQPDGHNAQGQKESCVFMKKNNMWHDNTCDSKLSFVCHKKGFWSGADGREYMYFYKYFDIRDAKETCQKYHAELANIDNDHTRVVVGNEFQRRNPNPEKSGSAWVWLGGHDEHSNNNFQWGNGVKVNKNYWKAGEPNNYLGIREDCTVTMTSNPLHVYDASCDNTKATLLCQRQPRTADGYSKGPDGMYYKFNTKATTSQKAREECQKEGASLAVVNNVHTFTYIQNEVKKQKSEYFWLGGNDQFSNNNWKWVNGENIEMNVNNKNQFWSAGEPNNWAGRQENCLGTSKTTSGRFMDFMCEWEGPVSICQRAPVSTQARTTAAPKKEDKEESYEKFGYTQGPRGNYYKYYSTKKTWAEAKKTCEMEDAMLAEHEGKGRSLEGYMSRQFPQNFWFTRDNNCARMDNKQIRSGSCQIERPFLCVMKGSFKKCDGGDKCTNPLLYPFGKSVGDHMLPKGDEEHGHLHFDKGYPFHSKLKSDLYINTNGHVTADKPSSRWADSDFKMSVGAIYKADFTTEFGGEVYYRVTNDKHVLKRAAFEAKHSNQMSKDEKRFPENYQPTLAVVVTWYNVRFTSDTSKMATFQLISHTDFTVSGVSYVFARLDKHDGLSGMYEVGCHDKPLFDVRHQTVAYEEGSNIGIRGVWSHRIDTPTCAVQNKKKQSMEIQWKFSDRSKENTQTFYFDGKDRVSQVFTSSYTWSYVSAPFVTKVTHGLDEVKVNYVYFVNAYKDFTQGSVATAIVRDSVQRTKKLQRGSMRLETSGENKCTYQNFQHTMDDSPNVLLNTMIERPSGNLDGLSRVWLRNVSREGFEVCYRGIVSFFGPNFLYVDYLAVTEGNGHIYESGVHKFDKMNSVMESRMRMDKMNYVNDKKDDKSSTEKSAKEMQQEKEMDRDNTKGRNMRRDENIFCQNIAFKYRYTASPAVFVTPEDPNANRTGNEEVIAWVKDIKRNYVAVCARRSNDDIKYGRKSEIDIHYTVHGEFDKCSTHKCKKYQECYLDEQKNPQCGCKKDCRDYPQKQFCATNFHTYNSWCELEQHMCKMDYNKTQRDSIKVAYNGMCKQYPYQTGKDRLEAVPEVNVAFCKRIKLDATNFNKHDTNPMRILLTVSWNQDDNYNNKLHQATAAWSEEVSVNGFKACVMVAGRHFFQDNRISSPPSVSWVAYQSGVASSTENLEVGTVQMKTWYSGSRCQTIKMDMNKYSAKTQVFVSVEHSEKRSLQNAMTAWVERNTATGDAHVCKICARELQNFDGVHKGIKIHYMVVHEETRPYITESRQIEFESQKFSKNQAIPPICKTVMFNNDYPKLSNPTVMITAVNTSSKVKAGVFSPHDFAVWLEGHNDTHLTACYKSLRAGMHREEVKLQYAIWPSLCYSEKTETSVSWMESWKFHDGKCYRTQGRNETYTGKDAYETCKNETADLPKHDGTESRYYFLRQELKSNTWIYTDPNYRAHGCMTLNFTKIVDENSMIPCEDKKFNMLCEKDSNLMKRGCHCKNNGTCVSQDKTMKFFTEKPTCKCENGWLGEQCETRDQFKDTHCNKYEERKSNVIGDGLQDDVWYRFPGQEMAEYCPRHSGCVTLDGQRPSNKQMVTKNIIYSNHAASMWTNGRCEKMSGKVHIQNCGKYNVYRFEQMGERLARYGRFCLERNPNEPEKKDDKNQSNAKSDY